MGAAGIARTPAATRRSVLTLTSAVSLMVVLDALMVTTALNATRVRLGASPANSAGPSGLAGGNSTFPAQSAPKRAMPPRTHRHRAHDPFAPVSNGRYLAGRIPGSQLSILDAGHFAWEQVPASTPPSPRTG
jgi:pimeloyl-ACP methyl ester carboxylesterase